MGDIRNVDRPIEIFKSFDFPDAFTLHHRRPVQNIDEIEKKWLAFASFLGVDPNQEVQTGSILHDSAGRANVWWNKLISFERNFWKDRPDPNDHQNCRMHYPDGYNFIRCDIKPTPFQLSWASYQYEKTKPILEMMDACSMGVVQPNKDMLMELHPDVWEAFKVAALANDTVAERLYKDATTSRLYVMHKSDKSNMRCVFNPDKHVRLGDFVLLHTEAGQGDSHKGWDLARVSKMYELQDSSGLNNKYIDVVYIIPAGVTVHKTGPNAGTCSDWGDINTWILHRFKDWPLGKGKKRSVWGQSMIGMDSVVFSCTPTADDRFRKQGKDFETMKGQIIRMQSSNRINAPHSGNRPGMDMFGTTGDDDED